MKRINFFMICALISVYTLAQNEWADIWCNQWNILEYNVSGMGASTICTTMLKGIEDCLFPSRVI